MWIRKYRWLRKLTPAVFVLLISFIRNKNEDISDMHRLSVCVRTEKTSKCVGVDVQNLLYNELFRKGDYLFSAKN